MAVAYRSKSNNGGASGGDLTVNAPAGLANDDILIAHTYSEGSGTAFTLPAGWAWVAAAVQNSNGNFWHRMAWKRAASEGASWTFTHSPSAWRTVVVSAWSGAITSGDPQDSTADADNAASTTVTAGTITNATANSMNVASVMSYNLDNLGASASGYTDVGIFDSDNLFYALQASSGASGTKTFTSASASGNWSSWHLSIKQADATNIDTVRNPEFVAAGAQTVTLTIGATLAPALPAGWAVGDLLVMIIAGRCNGSTITNSFSNTWTLAGERFREIGAGATDLYIGVYYRYAEVGEAAPTVTPDADFLTSGTTGGVSAQIAGFRYTANTQDATAATNDAAAATTWTPPSVTTNRPNSLVISCVATSDDNALNFNTANSFSLAMSGASYDTTTGSDHAVGMGYYVQANAGAVTMPIWNESLVGTDPWVGVTVAFRRKVSNPPYAKRPLYIWRSKNQ